ncbi:MAG: lipid-A-disaccharide synthase [Armatimonadota bacterium]|nr:lipid-A-disaccharide synthase [bacterium]
MSYSIAISAGEASGDMYGGRLAAELRKLHDGLELWGAGGRSMRNAGVNVEVDMTGGGTIGISETLKSLPGVAAKYFKLRGLLLDRRPDLFIPIDFGAFNIRLAQIARKSGIPVVYYFPPSSWRKRPKNAEKLLACGGKVVTPFPWSGKLLSEAGVDARFVGHPLVDIVKPTVDKAAFLREFDLSDSLPTIGMLPGSRSHELNEHMPIIIGCARIIHRELGGAQFVIGAGSGANRIREQVAEASKDSGFPVMRVIEGRTYDCMAHADLLISKSGTATLEAAILGTPMVIIYCGSWIMRFEFLFRKAVLEEYIGLPNIIADRGVCPELINEHATPEAVSDIALSLLGNEESLSEMRASLNDVRRRLGENDALVRTAKTLLDMGGLT